MVNWGNILNDPTGRSAIKMFANGDLSCETVQRVFRNRDRDSSGQIRNLIRNKGTAEARRIAKKALKRRNLI